MRLGLGILRVASWLVPVGQREEWIAEWESELSFVREHRAEASTRFSLGAFRDALWLRRNDPKRDWRDGIGSPAICLASLATVAIAAGLVAFQVPGIRDVMRKSPRNLETATTAGPTEITVDEFRTIRDGSMINRVAFFQAVSAHVGGNDLTIARASANLFTVLHVPVPPGAQLILSEHAWHNRFHTVHPIVGRTLEVDGRALTVAAILPDHLWRLPQRVDGWLLDDGGLPALPSDSKVIMVGRRIRAEDGWRPGVVPVSGPAPSQLLLMLLPVGLALLILPSVTTFALGEYPANRRLRRWGFLALKIAFILPLVFFGALDASFLLTPVLLPHALLIGYFTGFRWALSDQRRRCPVCLRRLACPARIGWTSNVLLDWCGTEFACTRGHGLLHVPEILAGSYSISRWMQLDNSWSGLFVAPFKS